jgi:hypothetical protein
MVSPGRPVARRTVSRRAPLVQMEVTECQAARGHGAGDPPSCLGMRGWRDSCGGPPARRPGGCCGTDWTGLDKPWQEAFREVERLVAMDVAEGLGYLWPRLRELAKVLPA